MTTDEFTDRMIGVPWVNRACSFTACDCWGLVTIYYRYVVGAEIHHDSGYESDSDFMTCYQNEVNFWKPEEHPVSGGIFVPMTDRYRFMSALCSAGWFCTAVVITDTSVWTDC